MAHFRAAELAWRAIAPWAGWMPGRPARRAAAGFLDGLAQRDVAGQRVAGDADGARGDVDVDAGDPGEPADLGPDGAGAVLAGHPGNRDGTSGHARHRNARTGDSDAV